MLFSAGNYIQILNLETKVLTYLPTVGGRGIGSIAVSAANSFAVQNTINIWNFNHSSHEFEVQAQTIFQDFIPKKLCQVAAIVIIANKAGKAALSILFKTSNQFVGPSIEEILCCG